MALFKKRCNKLKSFFLLLLVSPSFSLAGKVSLLKTNDEKVPTIHLKMGRSTVIRFREKPQKIVVGNQNYFNIEFIGNDVTIQPQAMVISNLFVYGKHRVYGFLLKVGGGEYDDLVKVRWRSPSPLLRFKKKDQKTKAKLIEGDIHLTLKDKLLLRVERIKQAKQNKKLYFMEILLKNISSKQIKTSSLKIFLTGGKGERLKVQSLFQDKSIHKGAIVKGRLLFHAKKAQDLFLYLGHEGRLAKTLIPRGAL